MAQTISVYNGSSFKEATEVHMYDGSVYRDCSEVHVWNGSAWKQVFAKVAPAVVSLAGFAISYETAGGDTVALRINSDGTIDQGKGGVYTQINSGSDWIIPNSASTENTYHVRATLTGDSLTTGTLNTWLEIGVDTTEWTRFALFSYTELTISISDDGGSSTIDSAVYSLEKINS
jgi:hypothetical protein